MEQNEQKFTSKQAEIIGNFALYSGIVGQQTVTVSTQDLSLLVAMALRAEPAEGSLKASQYIVADKEKLIGELKKDVKAAEAYSEKLDGLRKAEGAEKGKALDAAVYWRDAIGDIHKALGGNDVVDVDGLDDGEFVECLVEAVKQSREKVASKRDDSIKLFNDRLLSTLGIQDGFTTEGMLQIARTIKYHSDEHEKGNNNWRAAYVELMKTIGLSFVTLHDVGDCAKVVNQARKLYQMEGRRDGTVSASLMRVHDHAFRADSTIESVRNVVHGEVNAVLPEVK